MNLVKWDPFSELEELQKSLLGSVNRREISTPTMDVWEEKGEKIVVETHVAGFSKDDIDVDIHEGMLEIRGEKQQSEKSDSKDKKYMIKESTSSFYRRIRLPKHINDEKIEAHFENGTLRVEVPYKELPKPKKVKIKSKN